MLFKRVIGKEGRGGMCEANVFLRDREGNVSLFFERVDRLTPEGNQLVLQDIFGRRKIITAEISELLLASHKIILKQAD
jgi:predicted RNA-binding protein